MTATDTRIFAKFRKASKRIRTKVEAAKPLTKVEKREILVNARDLLSTNYASGDWRTFVDNVEGFCMYGALQAVAGYDTDRLGSEYDSKLSQCSLTSTLYDAIPADHPRKRSTEREIDQYVKSWDEHERVYNAAHIEATVLGMKVSSLQGINDYDGQNAVLGVFDKAIADLS